MEPDDLPGTATRLEPPGRGAKLPHSSRSCRQPAGGRGLTAWEIASENIQESLASGAAPSLELLGRLVQLGSLPALAAALRTGVNAAAVTRSP